MLFDAEGNQMTPSSAVKKGTRYRCQSSRWTPPLRNQKFADLYGSFPVKWFFGLLPVLCWERKRPFFVVSPAIRFPERAEGVEGPKC